MKDLLIESLDHLSTLCLTDSDTYRDYSDKELVNATVVFSHFLFGEVYKKNLGMDQAAHMAKAEESGRDIRDLIQKLTGKDMHILVKQVYHIEESK